MNKKNDFALVPRVPRALEKTEPGAKRILSGMVAETLALARKEPASTKRPLRIVSVDDEEWRLGMVELVISSYFNGVTLQSFQNAEEGWQELSRTDPDLLITDDLMGKLNGDEIVRRLADRGVSYPIIVISGWPETEQWVSEYAGRGLNVALVQLFRSSSLECFLRALESGLKLPRAVSVDGESLYREARAYDALQNRDYAEMIRLYRQAADRGHAEASMMLWAIYLDPGACVPPDTEQAFYWLRKAAEQGCEYAPLQLGLSYERGIGVPRDYAQAAHWYRRAADQGVESAKKNLGALYANGRVAVEDPVEAYQWVKLAEDSGCGGAALTADMLTHVFTSPEEFQEAERRYHQLCQSKGSDAPRKNH